MWNVKDYLRRINYYQISGTYDGDRMPLTGKTLSMLQTAHLMNVPFENFDIMAGTPLSLATEDLFEKIVLRRRGGFCFELNGLFGDLLRALDFSVTDILARFLYQETSVPMYSHRALLVEAADGHYLCDVGVGLECPRIALKIEENLIQNDGFCDYKLTKEPFLGWVLWQKKDMSEWKKFYSFTDEVRLSVDFIQPSFYCEKHPNSSYNKANIASIKTETGIVSLDSCTIKISERNQATQTVTATSNAELQALISKYFDINIDFKE